MSRRLLLALAGFLLLLVGMGCVTRTAAMQASEWTELGNNWAELGKWDRAGQAWSKAMALDPSQVTAGYNLARALAEAGKHEEALSAIDKVLERDKDNAMAMSLKAYTLHKAGRAAEAIPFYERVVAMNAQDTASRFNLAVLLDGAGRRAEALAIYRALLAEDSGNAVIMYRIGLLELAAGNHDAAIEVLNRFLDVRKNDQQGLRALAAAQEGAGRYGEADKALTALVAAAPGDALAWFDLARLRLAAMDDAVKGLEALRKALSAGFKDSERAARLMTMRNLVAREDVVKILKEAGLLPEPEDNPAAATAGRSP
jgi:tetratricopeptide (TPR) repeat protein